MSNCLETAQTEIVLDESMFDYNRLFRANDTDGSVVFFDPKDNVWVFRVAQLTTIRELRNFIWNNIQPFVKVPNVRFKFPCREESDGFKQEFNWVVSLMPPGTVRNSNNSEQIFR
jgi:hypothetical protein